MVAARDALDVSPIEPQVLVVVARPLPGFGWTRFESLGTLDFMTGELHLTIVYADAGDGWTTAQVAEIPGAISEGATRGEARSNVLDALETVLPPDEELGGTRSDTRDAESVTLTVA